MKCVDAATMQQLDREAGTTYGLIGPVLMENAGRAVARRAEALLLTHRGRTVGVVCGGGNNGGDGLVAARHLANRGWRVRVVMATGGGSSDPSLSPDAAANFQIVTRMGLEVYRLGGAAGPAAGQVLQECDVVVDAVLGTGARGAPRGPALEAVQAIQAADRPVVAVDLPTGVDSDTGAVPGPAVRAVETVTFGLPKPGHILLPGAMHCGTIWVADIGFPAALLAEAPATLELAEAEAVRAMLPPRPPDAHKGSFGHVLVVAGSRGMMGAGALATRASVAAGAGLTTWAMPASLQDPAATLVPEALTVGLAEMPPGRVGGAAATHSIVDLAATRDVLLIGPGLGTEPATADVVLGVLAAWPGPAVVDADALNILAAAGLPGSGGQTAGGGTGGGEGGMAGRSGAAPRVFTPHPGELARLLGGAREGAGAAAIQADRPGAAREAARRLGGVVVLKGARTLVAAPGNGPIWVNPAATAALATGGSGDVLSGVIAGLLAQGVPAQQAAVVGAYVHGLAAHLAVAGDARGLGAARLARWVGRALRWVAAGRPIPAALEPVRRMDPLPRGATPH